MLRLQIRMLLAYRAAAARTSRMVNERLADERGEITSTVAIIGVLVVGALAAGAIVASRMRSHAIAIPNP